VRDNASFSSAFSASPLKADAVRADYRRKRSASDAAVAEAVTRLQKLEGALTDAQRNLARYQALSISSYLTA